MIVAETLYSGPLEEHDLKRYLDVDRQKTVRQLTASLGRSILRAAISRPYIKNQIDSSVQLTLDPKPLFTPPRNPPGGMDPSVALGGLWIFLERVGAAEAELEPRKSRANGILDSEPPSSVRYQRVVVARSLSWRVVRQRKRRDEEGMGTAYACEEPAVLDEGGRRVYFVSGTGGNPDTLSLKSRVESSSNVRHQTDVVGIFTLGREEGGRMIVSSFTQLREPGYSLRGEDAAVKVQVIHDRRCSTYVYDTIHGGEVVNLCGVRGGRALGFHPEDGGKASHYHRSCRYSHSVLKFIPCCRKGIATRGMLVIFEALSFRVDVQVPQKYMGVIIQLYFLVTLRIHVIDERRNASENNFSARTAHPPDFFRKVDVGVYTPEKKQNHLEIRANVALSFVATHPYPDIRQPRLVPVSLVKIESMLLRTVETG
ncbi:hypothetical protein F5146DRAFT_1189174 [Armillaria mellea]|nr:hypothetical protein F5146DRAFT_1189174 [Armillaria mellea]